MAQRTTVSLVDDLDQSDADETVEFGVDGVSYAIDLSKTNAASLRDALAAYVAHARRTSGRRRAGGSTRDSSSSGPSRPTRRTGSDRDQNKAIRDWARRQGKTISERGRIPSEISEAYHQAH